MPQGSTLACACVTGYQMVGNDCVWGTVPADQGFQNVPAGAWTLDQGALLNATAAGHIDPGELNLSPTAFCTGHGRARQSISMPTVAQSEPFAIKLSSNTDCVSRLMGSCWAVDPVIAINGGVIVFRNGPVDSMACLGERAYGGTLDLVIGPPNRMTCGAGLPDTIVDHIDIEPSSACPPPGTLPNGDFDGTSKTWRLWTASSHAMKPVSEIAPSVGSAGSAAAHLALAAAASGDEAVADELISPPLSTPNLAVQVRFKGNAGATARVLLDGVTMAVLPGTGAQVSGNICLLESNKGMTQSLALGLGFPTSFPGNSATATSTRTSSSTT